MRHVYYAEDVMMTGTPCRLEDIVLRQLNRLGGQIDPEPDCQDRTASGESRCDKYISQFKNS